MNKLDPEGHYNFNPIRIKIGVTSMKTKARTKSTKSTKLTDLKARKNPKGGAQKGRTNSLGPREGWTGGGNHNETFLADW